MAYTQIDKTKLTGAVYDNVKTALETISDPTSQEKRKFIYAREPHVKGASFEGYPIIIIKDYSVEDTSMTVNGENVLFNGSFEIHVVAHEDDMPDFDTLSDDVLQTLLSSENASLGEHYVSRISVDRNQKITGINEKEEFIIRREMEFAFRMQVSM